MIQFLVSSDPSFRRCMSVLDRITRGPSWTDQDRRWFSRRVLGHFKNLAKLRRVAVQNPSGAFRLQDHILTSYSGRLCGLLEALGRSSKAKCDSRQALDALLKGTKPTQRLRGMGRIKFQGKEDGTRRMIISPDIRVRAAQNLVAGVLQAWAMDNCHDFNMRGRGTTAAVAEISRMILEDGLRSFVLFDLANYFRSVKPTHLDRLLPLPRKVMRHSVFFCRDALLIHPPWDAIEAEAARQCLPTGARLSGIVAAMLLGSELRNLNGEMGIVTYVDDGVIGGCDPAGAKCLAETLKDRFSNHPGGPLDFKYITVVDAADGFAFLGYWIRAIEKEQGPEVVIRPSHEARMKLRKRLHAKLRKAGDDLDFDKAGLVAGQYMQRWLRSFSLWQPSAVDLENLRDEISVWVSEFFSGYTSKIKPSLPSV